MAFSNIDSLALGNLLQIVFSNGVRNQISQDFRDFEMIKRAKVGNSLARELRFMFQNTLGAAAIQYRNPGTSGRAFPLSQQASVNEYTAKFKEMNATIELEYNLYDRARHSPEKYAEPLSIELDSKASASKRRLAADLYADGSGVMGTVASAAVLSPADGTLWFLFSTANAARGHAGFAEYGDIWLLKAAAGTASALDTSLATEPVYWKVVEKDRDNARVRLQGLDSAYANTGTISSITTQPTAGDVFYRYGQPTIPNLGSISDYGTATEVMAGLESLAANDSRVIHGITMSGSNAGTHQSCAGNPIDVKYIEKVMNKVKLAVGQDRYRWKMMNMAPETQSSFIESRETDRRFNSIEDAKRGVKVFGYQHGNDFLECNTSEYCPPKRIWILPESKAGEKVMEFHGSDFTTVKTDGEDFRLQVSGGTYVNTMVSFLQAVGVYICKHPAAIACVEDFVNT